MDALVTAIIAAGAAIAAAIISAVVTTRKLDKTVAIHDTKTDGAHTALSKEHVGLSKEHDGLKAQVALVGGDVSFLRDEKLKEQGRVEHLSAAQRQLTDSAENIGKFAVEFARLAAENAALRQENTRLTQQLCELEAHRGEENDEELSQ